MAAKWLDEYQVIENEGELCLFHLGCWSYFKNIQSSRLSLRDITVAAEVHRKECK